VSIEDLKLFAVLLKARSGRELREIPFEGPQSLTISQFPAYDFFGDGSFYLLDSPGHAVGHLCGLARTTTSPDTFVLMGGDVCHYSGIMRPSKLLPIPPCISPHPCYPSDSSRVLCPGHAWEKLQATRSRAVDDTLYDLTFGLDIPLATKTVGQLQELDCNEDIFVIIAHDATVRDGVPHFPENLNSWKASGWGERLRWAFLRDLREYWSSQGCL
jgi:glyoxylase-like metal-dependent hydrolase (beta-lactamase superfamily II)